MSLIPVDAEYHYVQDTAPTTANAGDVWLDTSQNPPVAKIYADVGNGLEWLVDQSSDRIATNLDAPVSEAGQGVDWASKTPRVGRAPAGSTLSIDGSGFLIGVAGERGGGSNCAVSISIDGTELVSDLEVGGGQGEPGVPFLHRFGSNLTVTELESNDAVKVIHVLD